MKMENDVNRFRKIVRGKIKENLKKFISTGELIGRQGKKQVTIPIPRIDLPRFQFGSNQPQGVGQGEGEVGDKVGQGEGEEGPGQGEAGDKEGQHSMEVDVTLEELADILGEQLELPNIEDKGKNNLKTRKLRYKGLLRNGPESLRNFKKTYKEALKRMVAADEYNPEDPKIVPIKEDKRYRSFKVEEQPEASAVIVYMMDVSGSMGDEQKEIVRLTSFWIDTWLSRHYENLETRYIIHDAVAKEVDKDTFYHTRESGGTLISSAFKLCQRIVLEDYPEDEWNIYLFHFSDGDNWSGNDTNDCLQILDKDFLPRINQFAYGQVESRYGSGQFMRDLEKHYSKGHDKLVLTQIKSREDIMASLKTFLGKGR